MDINRVEENTHYSIVLFLLTVSIRLVFQDFENLEKNGSVSQISLKRVIKSYCRNENSPNNARRAGLTEAAKRGGTSADTNAPPNAAGMYANKLMVPFYIMNTK